MSDNLSVTEVAKFPCLTYSREFFADYLTALISRIHQSGDTDVVFSGATPHPLLGLQTDNLTQLNTLTVRLVVQKKEVFMALRTGVSLRTIIFS